MAAFSCPSLFLFFSFLLLLLSRPFSTPSSAGSIASDIDADLAEIEALLEADDSLPASSKVWSSEQEKTKVEGEGEGEEGEGEGEAQDAEGLVDDKTFFGSDAAGDGEIPMESEIEDPDVVVLAASNFTEFVKANNYVMVEFYAPWCGHCQALTPEYAAAATQLKADGVPLAKVDATIEYDLGQSYGVEGFPTILFFIDGVPRPYSSHRTAEAIVSWIKKKLGPSAVEVTDVNDAATILESGTTVVAAFFENLQGPEVEEFASAARQEDDVLFYQTTKEDIADVFNFKKGTKTPAVVLLKKANEKVIHYDGKFERGAIYEFVQANKMPLVTVYSRDTATLIFDNPIKRQLLLFLNPKEDPETFSDFEEAAKSFKGKIIFVLIDPSDQELGKPIMEYFGISGDEPKIVGYTILNEQPKKFFFEGKMTLETMKGFGEDFLADKIQQFYKSDPVPETNDGDVKVVVGKNLDEIVLDESKDVLLEIYAPWCGHCEALEPIYKKLGRVFRSVESVVIAKMDGTSNEHERAKPDGFPTILFFPAGKKSFDPITFDGDRTVKGFYQFIKSHATIPFTLPVTEKKAEPMSEIRAEDVSHQPKDEL